MMQGRYANVSIYPEVIEVLGFHLDNDDEIIDEEDEEDESEGSLGFTLKKMIFPLGLGTKQWSFNPLGLVTNLTGVTGTNFDGKNNSLDRERHTNKIFCLEFSSAELPFEFNLDTSGKVVVSKCFDPIDSRIQRGVTIYGVNKTPLPVGHNSIKAFEDILEKVNIPFTIVFEALDQHHQVPYEEESDSDVDEKSQREGGGDENDDDDEEHEEENVQTDLQAILTVNTTASLIRSGIKTISSRVRSLVVGEAAVFSDATTPQANNTTSKEADQKNPSTKPSGATTATNSLNEDGSFSLILNTRTPPFVFDLHADGRSIVVVKLLDAGRVLDPFLQEGCVVRRLNSKIVLCASRHDFEFMLANEPLPLRLELETAPALYRHQDALHLYTAATSEPYLHVFTVLPSVSNTRARSGSLLFGTEDEYDDVFVTSRRALQVLQAFRAQGIAVQLVSIETVIVNTASGAYAGLMLGQGSASVRGVRVWFRFSEAIDVGPVDNPKNYLSALQVARTGVEGSWIVLRCIAESPWVDAGMVLGRPYLLTHVNGRDISASGYRSVQPRVRGDGDWESSVLSLLEDANKVRFTLV